MKHNILETSMTSSHLVPRTFKRNSPGSLFQRNPYTRLLNHLLQNEQGCIEVYNIYSSQDSLTFQANIENHNWAKTTLTSLLFRNRGLNEDSLIQLPTDVSIIFAQLLEAAGSEWICGKARHMNLKTLENYLLSRYRRAYGLAPRSDRALLNQLALTTLSNIDKLS